jgi:hypothetical protein
MLKILNAHLDMELQEHDNRSYYEFDEPLPFEKLEIERIKAEQDVS